MPSLHHDQAYDEREEFDKDDEMEYARVAHVPAGTPMVTGAGIWNGQPSR